MKKTCECVVVCYCWIGCPVLLIRKEKLENFSKQLLMRPWLGPYVKQHCLFKSESVTHLSSTIMGFSHDALLSGSGKKRRRRKDSLICFWDTWWQCRLWWLMDDCVSRWIWVSFNELPTHSQMKMVVSIDQHKSLFQMQLNKSLWPRRKCSDS